MAIKSFPYLPSKKAGFNSKVSSKSEICKRTSDFCDKLKKDNYNLKVSSKSKVSAIVRHLVFLLENKGFFSPLEKKHSMILNINNLIYKLEPNDKELRILASIISSLSKK